MRKDCTKQRMAHEKNVPVTREVESIQPRALLGIE
jgi:hypothetical protein